MSCHNCGLHNGAISLPGREVALKEKPKNNFSRERTITVWVCSDECAIQAMAIAKWGPATNKWPISLAQYRATKPLTSRQRKSVD